MSWLARKYSFAFAHVAFTSAAPSVCPVSGARVSVASGVVLHANSVKGKADAKKLARSDGDASKALVQEIALPPPERFPHIRPDEDFNVKGRAGLSLHSGPKALVLSADRKTVFVLNRFTGTIASIDVTHAAKGKAAA